MAAQTNSTTGATQDVAQRLDADFGVAIERVDHWIDSAIRLLPNLAVALMVLLLFYGLGLFARRLIVGRTSKRDRENLGVVLGSFVKWSLILMGFLLAATIILPSLKPGDLIAGLGVSSVAIGFAFKDILQNWLAGLLILLRQPFSINDQISVNGFEGTVERVETRATIIRTYDGQRAVIPNSDIYTNAVLVKTAHEKRRSQYDVGIGYGDDVEQACRVIREAIGRVPDIEQDPAPEALPWELAASWVSIRARWWTNSRQVDVVLARSAVILSIKKALDEAGIDMPFETSVQLFHDQTESDDGVRGVQREGWPDAGSPAAGLR